MSTDPTRDRSDVPANEQWNLSALFADDAAWEKGLEKLKKSYPGAAAFEGRLAESAETLKSFLAANFELGHLSEQLVYYAHLRVTEDMGDSDRQSRLGRYMQISAEAEAALSFASPEIQTIPDEKINAWIEREDFTDYRIFLTKLLRYKPHILSPKEEKLLAMQIESNQTPSKTFNALMDVDMNFGTVSTPEGDKPLTNGTFAGFMQNPDRKIRTEAFTKYYAQMTGHQNTIASLYAGSVQLDIYQARIRGYANSLEAALFPDKVDFSVYHNLVKTINDNLSHLHSYYRLRKERQNISDYSLIDTKVPLVADLNMNHTYDEAVDVVVQSLSPLGSEYTDTLEAGLRGGAEGGWVDKYENKGKRSGAFSAGSFSAEPYILMNFKEDMLREVFTLAHEAGHSMHSWYSTRNNPFPHYNYTIFEAEVASTFNEQFLFHYMLSKHEDRKLKAYLVNKQIDDMIATIFRQTMFAEFELRCHELVEGGQALTVQLFRDEYAKLLKTYFGSDVDIPEIASMEGLRIPHFYNAFYVYKYATGLSAAIALSQRVMHGSQKEQDDYFAFLKSGGSRFPIESLIMAGVDMSSPAPIQNAMNLFANLVDMLRELL